MKTFKFLLTCMLFISSLSYAQKTVSGTVTDPDGLPLPSAAVTVKGTDIGTTTNFDGEYSIEVKEGGVLQFSFMSFKLKELTVGDGSTYNVQLESDVAELDQVVIVGYGKQKKINLTGSVESVQFDEEVNQPVTNSGQLLYGRFSGVQLTQTSGSPGADGSSINIRGIGTFGASNPLLVIDNIQYDGLAAFNNLAPADIESISVLKDASALAIYGSRGANGVIIVTTRKGKEGEMKINYNGYYGVQDATVRPDFLNALDYATMMNEKYRNEDGPNFNPRYTPEQIDAIRTGSLPDQFANTNWVDEVLQQAAVQNHNLSFTGGSEKTTYRVSLGFLTQDPIIKSKFKSERYNLSANINSQVKDWLNLSFVSNSFWRHNEAPTGGQGAFNGDNGIIYSFQRTAPTIPLFYSNGEYGVADGAWLINDNPSLFTQNPVRRGFLGNSISDNINSSTRIALEAKISDHITFETSGSANIIYSNSSNFNPTQLQNDWEGNLVIRNELNSLRNGTNLNYTLLNENILRYDNTFGDKHNVGGLLGHAISFARIDGFNGSLRGFPTDNLEEFNAGAITDPQVNGSAFEEAYQSFFTRLSYNFDEKYLFEFNYRVDGSYKLGPGLRYDEFPSASVGWNIHKEDFFNNFDFINSLKLRGSWGITGNDRIGRGIWEQTYNPNLDYVLGANETSVIGVGITQIANPNIGWEKTNQVDIGLDVSFLRNKINLVADYFKRNTEDILYANFPVPNTIGVTNLGAVNSASMVNEGLELSLNYRGNLGDARFSLGTNLTKFLNNEVTSLGGGSETITNINIIREGAPFRAYYGYQAIGVFQSLEEVANAPTQFGNALTGPGDLRYADINNDGVVDADDRTIIGDPNPELLVNFNGSIEYKKFDINMLFQGVSGVDRLFMGNGNLPMSDNRSNALSYWIDRWTPENPSVNLPRVGGQNNTEVSSFYIQDVSYLRLKNLEIGYTIPKTLLEKAKIDKLRVFVGAQNLVTFTGLENFDPEGANGAQSNRNAPLYQTITLGLNVKL